MLPTTFYIESISTDGFYFLPLSMENVIGRILFMTQTPLEEILATLDTDKEFEFSFEYRDGSGQVIRSENYPKKLKAITDLKGNLMLGGEGAGYHTKIKVVK